MDDRQTHQNDTLDLTLHGTAIPLPPPAPTSSRPSSARSNSQLKQPETPTRKGSAQERRPSLSTSVNFSSARQRRLSNSSQRSIGITSPPVDAKKSTASSRSSSISRTLTPRQQDADAFFTDQSQQKSFPKKFDDDEWDDTRRWVNEINQLNESPVPERQNERDPLFGMSHDSLNGTVTRTNLFQSDDNRREPLTPTMEQSHDEQLTPRQDDIKTENDPTSIPQLHYENDGRHEQINSQQQEPREQERLPSFEQITPRQTENQHEITTPRGTRPPSANSNSGRLSKRRLSSASSTSQHQRTPVSSPLPPTSRIDQKIRSIDSIASSTATTSSKVTLNDVYETLRKLEEVEQFPVRPPSEDDSAYAVNMNVVLSTPFIDEVPSETSNYVNSTRGPLDETNQDNRIFESVRSPNITTHETFSPSMTHYATPLTSDRRQQSKRLVQSATVPHNRLSSSIDRHTRNETKVTAPYKSLVVAPYHTSTRENDMKTSNRTMYDSGDKSIQFRINPEGKQRPKQTVEQRLDQQREITLNEIKHDHQHNFDYLLQKQKDEYEAIIQRHLKFIDQLIDDKKKLSQRCELLVTELKTIDKKYDNRIRSLEGSHQDELKKLRDVHETAEKLRRERWIEEKTRKIKELTVRGLEPEIQKLISKHKGELAKIKTVHEAELLAADERASQRYIRMTEELRDQLEREKEVAIAHERELAREKYEKSLREEEKSFTEQRQRLYTELEEEKTRQAELMAKQRAELDKLRRDIEENHRAAVNSTKQEYEAMRLEQERRHTNDIQELKDRLMSERQNWEESLLKQQEAILASKEHELRSRLKQERDSEIEKIISQFETDTTVAKEEAEQSAETRVKRIRDKYETEFQELENSEKKAKEQYHQIRAQMTEVQGDNERLQVLLRQRETEINDIRKITETLQQERDRLTDIIRQEFADRLVLTEDENRRVKGEIAELRARQQLELEKRREEVETLRQQQENELETIQEKIKQAITKKDEQVRGLHVQYEAALKRAEHLEGLLAQQRKLISALPSGGTSASKKVHPS